MPALYGNPRKDTLRKEIRELGSRHSTSWKEHAETRRSLDFAQARITLMTKKAELVEAKLKDLLAEASKEISSREVVNEARRQKQASDEAMVAAFQAEAASAQG
jgi:hypothetical protein